MKKILAAFSAAFLFCSTVFSIDLTLRLTPGVFLPAGTSNYSTGFAGFVQADADFLGFVTAGAEGFYSMTTPAIETGKLMNMFGGGAGLGLYYSPFSRLYLGAGGALGLYQFSVSLSEDENASSAAGYYWRAYGEAGFRITPSLTVSAVGSYIDYRVSDGSSLLSGADIGLGVRYAIPLGKRGSSSFGMTFTQEQPAFPLFMSAYRNFELGTLVLHNNESSEIRNVHVSFRAGKYTASTYESEKLAFIGKHSSVEIPLKADFSTEILKYSENGKLSGEIVVDYELLGKKKQSVQNVAISMNNRNAFSWSDPSALSAFISSETPEVQQLASIISGIETNNLIPGMNKNFQMAAAVFEGLRLSGIKYIEDKVTPYTKYHLESGLDSIQYPVQTMNYLSGDLDDIGILLASCLESVGVPTGYVLLDNDFVVLVGMNIKTGTEKNHFTSDEGLISDENNVYFGLSMKDFEKGFIQSRKTASKEIAAAKADTERYIDYAGTEESWGIYSPAVFSGTGGAFDYPSRNAVEKAVKNAVNDYINTDLAAVVERARKSGDPNKLGVAYLRSGRLAEAKAEFSKSASTSCMNNLASCYMAEKNYSAAAAQYKKVLAKAPENRIALKGLDAANEKLGL